MGIPAPSDVGAHAQLVFVVQVITVTGEDRVVVAVLALAAVAHPAAKAERQVVLAQRTAAGEPPAPVGVVADVGAFVVAESVIDVGVDGVSVVEQVIESAAATRVEEHVVALAAAKGIGALGRIHAIAAEAGLRIAEARKAAALVEKLRCGLVIGFDLRQKVGRQVFEMQDRLEGDLRFRVLPEREVRATQAQVRGHGVGFRGQHLLEHITGLCSPARLEQGLGLREFGRCGRRASRQRECAQRCEAKPGPHSCARDVPRHDSRSSRSRRRRG